jgi:hypothetical protein
VTVCWTLVVMLFDEGDARVSVGFVPHASLGRDEMEVLARVAVRVQQQRAAPQNGPEQEHGHEREQEERLAPSGACPNRSSVSHVHHDRTKPRRPGMGAQAPFVAVAAQVADLER